MSVVNQTNINEDFLIILRTIVTFLENHNFKNTLTTLNSECVQLGLTNFHVDKFRLIHKLSTVNEYVTENTEEINISRTPEYLINEQKKDLATNKECNSITDEELFASIQSEDLTPLPTDIQILPLENIVSRPLKDSTSFTQEQKSKLKTFDYNMNNHVNDIKESQLKKNKPLSYTEDSVAATLESSFEEDSLSPQDNLKDRFLLLQDEHRKLMEITSKLTVAFQRNIKGQTDNMNTILNNCKDIFPELFYPKSAAKKKNYFTLTKEEFRQYITHELIDKTRRNSTASSHFSTDTFDETGTTEIKKIDDLPSNFQLDFNKIKTDLRNGDTNTKLALLQALRWRITRNPSSIRNEVMATYERFDLLDIRNCSHRNEQAYVKNAKLLESLYCPKKTPDILQESIARLINSFASMKIGRDYLTRQSILMNFLLSILFETHGLKPKLGSKTKDMTIATLQKMSLRYWQRVTMINTGLCKYMVKFLSDNYKKLSPYCLEYSTALLMNLWLHVDAREKCYPLVKDIIKLLATLLDIKYENCLPYINGSLYTLLPDPIFHKVAKDVKLGQIIEYRIPTADSDMQEQLRCILKIYNDPTNWQPMCDCDLGVEIENEIDLFEPELDSDDKYYSTGLSGEQLLYNYRLLFPLNGSQVCTSNIILRPITPNFGRRTSFAVNTLSPYAKEENNYIIPESSNNVPYKQIKDFLVNRLSDNCIYREIDRIRHETFEIGDNNSNEYKLKSNKLEDDINIYNKIMTEEQNFVVLESDVENNNNTNEKIENFYTKTKANEYKENNQSPVLKKNVQEITSSKNIKHEPDKVKKDEIIKPMKTTKNRSNSNTINESSKQVAINTKNNKTTMNATKNITADSKKDGNMRIIIKRENSTIENEQNNIKSNETNENDHIKIIFKGVDESTSNESDGDNKNEKIRIFIKEIDTDQKSIETDNDEENTVKLLIIHDAVETNNETNIGKEEHKLPKDVKKDVKTKITRTTENKNSVKKDNKNNVYKNKPTKQQLDNNKDKNNNKRKIIEKEFIADTQKYSDKSAKDRSKTSNGFHSPSSSMKKNIDAKNKSLPTTPFYRSEPFIYQSSCPSTMNDELYYQINTSTSYWPQNYKPVCYCSSYPNSITNDKNKKFNKYSCQCYEKLKHSFEKDHNIENTKRNISPNRNNNTDKSFSSQHCKYTDIHANVTCSHNNETDSGFGSRPLDETDYDAVFESRPKILRTP